MGPVGDWHSGLTTRLKHTLMRLGYSSKGRVIEDVSNSILQLEKDGLYFEGDRVDNVGLEQVAELATWLQHPLNFERSDEYKSIGDRSIEYFKETGDFQASMEMLLKGKVYNEQAQRMLQFIAALSDEEAIKFTQSCRNYFKK